MSTFRALQVVKGDTGYEVGAVDRDDDDLPGGDVLIDVLFSDINYKDGLVMTGRFDMVTEFPRVPGIDLVGTVVEAGPDGPAVGDLVTVNGFGLGTDHDGGYTERARVDSAWVVPVPAGIDAWSAAAIGTAGYTAALGVLALQRLGVAPGAEPVLVTGAAGGAGTIATMLLSALGYETVASTGRKEAEESSLLRLGATSVIGRLSESSASPVGREKWGGAIDTVGSHTLVNVIAQLRYGGAVAAMGMAQGVDLPGTVVPFITRGVTLAGIDSVYAPHRARLDAWDLLAEHLDLKALSEVTATVGLSDAPSHARDVLAGRVRGRIVVEVDR